MKKIINISVIVMTTVWLLGCASTRGPELPANHLIDGTYINIHSPNSNGWFKQVHSDSQVVFAKYGNKSGESYIARVVFFPLEATNTKEEFLELIINHETRGRNKERFTIIESDFKSFEQRTYSCVIAKQLSKDKKAKTSPFSNEEQLMHVKSLFCKDPKREKAGFMVGYSFRGYKINKNFDEEADSFIDGVQFPNIK